MYPKKIYVELTTRCNLNCRKCVKHTTGSSIIESDMSRSVFNQLLPALAHAKYLVLNGIGEPMLHPHLLEIVRLAHSSMPKGGLIGFQSNGTFLDENLSKHLIEAGLGSICLSVDDLQEPEEVGEHQGEHSLLAVERAIKHLAVARKKSDSKLKIGVEIVLKKDTIHQLPDLVSWAADKGVDYIITTHLILYDKDSESETLFNPNSTKAIQLFDKYNQLAASDGIKLASCFSSYRKNAGTRSDSKVLQIFNDMQKEAREKDVRLNLQSLISHSMRDVEKVDIIFKQTRDIADLNNIELFLPPLQAPDQRSCPFIADKATFIAANGDVMPCHFLWHNYACWVHQEDIQVKERVLGNIFEHSLEKIWQKREYAEFRKEAGQYEYADCWSCPLAPCPSLVNTNVCNTHDCYCSQVPCGHCQWNLGGIRCM